MNGRKALIISLVVLLMGGCSSTGKKKNSSSAGRKTEKTEKATASPESSETPAVLSTDHTKLSDKTLSIDFDLLEKIPLNGTQAKDYISNSDYAESLNPEYNSPDPDGFEVTVTDQKYSWLQENYTFSSQSENPYLKSSEGSITVSVSGEENYENGDGYYPDTIDALKKNLTDAGYRSAGDHEGKQDDSGYQVNYYNYSKGGRMFSVSEVILNGSFSTGVIETGDPAE